MSGIEYIKNIFYKLLPFILPACFRTIRNYINIPGKVTKITLVNDVMSFNIVIFLLAFLNFIPMLNQ